MSKSKRNNLRMTEEQAEDIFVRFFLNMPDDQFKNDEDLVVQLENGFYYFLNVYQRDAAVEPYFQDLTAQFLNLIPQFRSFLPKNDGNANHFSNIAKRLYLVYQSLRRLATPCGCICYNKDLTHVLVVHHCLNRKLFSFPKGKMTEGESYLETACRETLEETGIDVSPYITDKYMFKYRRARRSDVYMFHVKNVPMDLSKPLAPPSSLEISQVRWMEINTIGKEKHYQPDSPTIEMLPIIKQFIKEQKH